MDSVYGIASNSRTSSLVIHFFSLLSFNFSCIQKLIGIYVYIRFTAVAQNALVLIISISRIVSDFSFCIFIHSNEHQTEIMAMKCSTIRQTVCDFIFTLCFCASVFGGMELQLDVQLMIKSMIFSFWRIFFNHKPIFRIVFCLQLLF